MLSIPTKTRFLGIAAFHLHKNLWTQRPPDKWLIKNAGNNLIFQWQKYMRNLDAFCIEHSKRAPPNPTVDPHDRVSLIADSLRYENLKYSFQKCGCSIRSGHKSLQQSQAYKAFLRSIKIILNNLGSNLIKLSENIEPKKQETVKKLPISFSLKNKKDRSDK